MSLDREIERGVELLTLCQRLQSENDGVQRAAPFSVDPSKVVDAFASDIQTAITNLQTLGRLMPVLQKLNLAGQKMQQAGTIEVESGQCYAQAALNHLMRSVDLDPNMEIPPPLI